MTAAVDVDGSVAAGEPHAGDERPALLADVELSRPLTPVSTRLADGRAYRELWIVVRIFDEPVAMLALASHNGEVSVGALCAAIEADCGDMIRERAAEAGVCAAPLLAGLGVDGQADPGFRREHASLLKDGPPITVVICTRNRPHDLARAIESLQAQTYSRFTLLVVDNAPCDPSTKELTAALAAADDRIRYVLEPRPGLSWARNHALKEIDTPLAAWLDDDEVADPYWLVEIIHAFAMTPSAVAVSGSVVPAELETQPQMWFEQYGGHIKGRGFRPAVFHGKDSNGQNSLYPLPAFGVGANMAFDVRALRSIGGFDTALGAGTVSLGGEDTRVFTQILLAGDTIVYQPSALTRHFHRPDYGSLANQMTGYGIGLTAYYASMLRHDWRLVRPMLHLLPCALRDMFGKRGDRLGGVPPDFPPDLLRRKTIGMLVGPLAYLRSCRRAHLLSGGPS